MDPAAVFAVHRLLLKSADKVWIYTTQYYRLTENNDFSNHNIL